MITRNIVALKKFSINTGLEQASLEKGEGKRIKFKSESNYKSLLSFGNFREKHNGEPVVKVEKIEPVKKETVVIENSTIVSLDSISDDPDDPDTFIEIGQICENCGTAMKLSGESNTEEEHVYDFVCPICKTEKEVRVENLSEVKEDNEIADAVHEVADDVIENIEDDIVEVEDPKVDPKICPICGRNKRANSKYCKICNSQSR